LSAIEKNEEKKLSSPGPASPFPSSRRKTARVNRNLFDCYLQIYTIKIKKQCFCEKNTKNGANRRACTARRQMSCALPAPVEDGSRFIKEAQVGSYLGFMPRLDYSGTS
jgi:hypothetical protein